MTESEILKGWKKSSIIIGSLMNFQADRDRGSVLPELWLFAPD